MNDSLTEQQVAKFKDDGFLVLPCFYDLESEIAPIQEAIFEIIGLVCQRRGVSPNRGSFSHENFDDGYVELIKKDRTIGAEVYDAVKQIPAFIRLISSTKAESIIRQLRKTDLTGIGAASYGIRIDNPNEEMFRSQWHQEFMFQPQSIDGLVFWTPLVSLTNDMGPVVICKGSHKVGLHRVSRQGSYSDKGGAYQIGMVDEEIIASRYDQLAPLTATGDLIIMDFLTIHQSGFNVSSRSRWSLQSRFFNFRDPIGIDIGWKPSVTAGADIEKIFSDYFVGE